MAIIACPGYGKGTRRPAAWLFFVLALAWLAPSYAFTFEEPLMATAKGKGYNYRDSGSGKYMKKSQAAKRPANTVEKERRKAPKRK